MERYQGLASPSVCSPCCLRIRCSQESSPGEGEDEGEGEGEGEGGGEGGGEGEGEDEKEDVEEGAGAS